MQDQRPTEADAEHEAERELRELREAVLDDWLLVTSSITDTLGAMQQTLSWRVTRPLRTVRRLGGRVQEVGLVPAGRLAAVAVARRVGRR